MQLPVVFCHCYLSSHSYFQRFCVWGPGPVWRTPRNDRLDSAETGSLVRYASIIFRGEFVHSLFLLLVFNGTVRQAKWHCASYPVTWAGRPDLSQCVSDAVLDVHDMVSFSSSFCLFVLSYGYLISHVHLLSFT